MLDNPYGIKSDRNDIGMFVETIRPILSGVAVRGGV